MTMRTQTIACTMSSFPETIVAMMKSIVTTPTMLIIITTLVITDDNVHYGVDENLKDYDCDNNTSSDKKISMQIVKHVNGKSA